MNQCCSENQLLPVATPTHGLTNCEGRGVRARKALKDTDDFVVREVGWIKIIEEILLIDLRGDHLFFQLSGSSFRTLL